MEESQRDYLRTSRSCLNSSTSKHLYSFPKKPRFDYKNNLGQTSSGYLIFPNFVSKKVKGPSFTRSLKRMNFNNQSDKDCIPGPNKYNCEVVKQKMGFTMGTKLKNLELRQVQKTPGPAAYSVSPNGSSNNSPKFSKSRRQFNFSKDSKKCLQTPGPYYVETERLKSILSNYKNSQQTKIGLNYADSKLKNINQKIKKSKQIQERRRQLIGTKLPSSFGRSFAFKNQKIVKFDKEMKKSWFDISKDNVPGPASYRIFSEFGKKPVMDMNNRIQKPKKLLSQKRRSQTLPSQMEK